MSVLVTGASGFLGQEIVKQLTQKKYRVIALVRNKSRAKIENDLVTYVEADITDSEKINQLFQEGTLSKVIHLAYSMDIFGEDPPSAVNTNIQGFLNIVEACKRYSVQRLIWCSSVMVYGRESEYTDPFVHEDHHTLPATLYGKCKDFCEYLTKHYAKQFNQDIVCLRPTTIYGPGRYVRGAASFLYDCTFAAKTGEETSVNRFGKTNLIHVKDVTRAFLLALEADKPDKQIFNISGQAVCSESLIELYEKITGNKLNITFVDEQKSLFPSQLDANRAKDWLNYEPLISLEEGLSDYLLKFDPTVPLNR